MATKNRELLKSYFVKNAIPTEGNFADLIDSQLNQENDGVFKPSGEPLSVVSAGGDQRRVLRLYADYPAANPDWLISLNPQDPTNPANNSPGFGVADGSGDTRLNLDSSGNLVVTGSVTAPGGLIFAGSVAHIERDGALYRHTDGQCYLTVDDNFYIRKSGSATSMAHFNTSNSSLTVNGNIVSAGSIQFGGGMLHSDQGGSIELGNSSYTGVTPYIDFHFGNDSDESFNMRIINDGDRLLTIPRGKLKINGAIEATGNATIGGALTASGKLTAGGDVEIGGNIQIGGSRLISKDGYGVIETNKTDWLRINPSSHFPGIALYKPVSIGTGGLYVGDDWKMVPVNQLQVKGNAAIGGTLTAQGKLTVNNSLTTTNGAVLNGVAIGTEEYGQLPYPYETIQLRSDHNLRISFGTTQRFMLARTGNFYIYFNNGFWAFQDDGNLVKYRNDGTALWHIGQNSW